MIETFFYTIIDASLAIFLSCINDKLLILRSYITGIVRLNPGKTGINIIVWAIFSFQYIGSDSVNHTYSTHMKSLIEIQKIFDDFFFNFRRLNCFEKILSLRLSFKCWVDSPAVRLRSMFTRSSHWLTVILSTS